MLIGVDQVLIDANQVLIGVVQVLIDAKQVLIGADQVLIGAEKVLIAKNEQKRNLVSDHTCIQSGGIECGHTGLHRGASVPQEADIAGNWVDFFCPC